MWDQPLLADVLERLASFSRLICFDRRGCGISDPIPLGAVPVLDDWLDDLRAVMDTVGSEQAVLVGCSGGGPLSVLFAATYPDGCAPWSWSTPSRRFSRASDFGIGVPQPLVEWGLEPFARMGNRGAPRPPRSEPGRRRAHSSVVGAVSASLAQSGPGRDHSTHALRDRRARHSPRGSGPDDRVASRRQRLRARATSSIPRVAHPRHATRRAPGK